MYKMVFFSLFWFKDKKKRNTSMKSSWRHISLWRHFSSWRHQVQGFYCFAILVFEITLLSMQRNKENFFDTCDIEQICKFRRVLVKFGFLILSKVSSRCPLPSPIVFNSKKSHLWRHCDVIFFRKACICVLEDKTSLRPDVPKTFWKNFFHEKHKSNKYHM